MVHRASGVGRAVTCTIVVALQYDTVSDAVYIVLAARFPPIMVASKCVYPVRMMVAGYAVPTASTYVMRSVENHSYRTLLNHRLFILLTRYSVEVNIEVRVVLAFCGGRGIVLSTPRGMFPERVQ